jgi:hypothetical protein
MEGGQASIVVQNRQIDAQLEGDTWMVTVENGEVYEVPLAAIEGG